MIDFMLNGKSVSVDVPGDTPLLWVIREELGLTGSKFGCGKALCGACTMHLNGAAIRSCMMPVSGAAGQRVTTIEGIQEKTLHAVQKAWINNNVPQCGYCQTGQIMQAISFIERTPKVTEEALIKDMDGNICRCGSYTEIKQAMMEAARSMGRV